MTAVPDDLAHELDRLAALTKSPPLAIALLASEHGRTVKGLRSMIAQRRHGRCGRLTFLPPEKQDDYRLLLRYGYRKAEALAALGVSEL